MKIQKKHLIYLILSLTFLIILYSCGVFDPPSIAMKIRDGSSGWIIMKTGLTDTTNDQNWLHNLTDEELTEYANQLDAGGFDITWSTMEEADYYEIRILKKKITVDNWHLAALAKTVTDDGKETRNTTVSKLQPKIKGDECTGCSFCVATCPNMAITVINNKAVIDLTLCTGCGLCYDTCDYDAVTDNFFGELYHIGIRGFSSDGVPSEKVLCTNESYMLRYTNMEEIGFTIILGDTIQKAACGKCGDGGCYINKPENGGKGCPVGALYADAEGFIHIDQSKCIYCGYCIIQCIEGYGNASIRREVLSSSQLANKKKKKQ